MCGMERLQAFCCQGRWYNNAVLEYRHSINRVEVRAMYEERTYVEWHVSLFRGESLLYCGQQELHGVVSGGFLLEALPGEGQHGLKCGAHGVNKVVFVHLVRGGIRLD